MVIEKNIAVNENECRICRKTEFTGLKISNYVCDKCFEKELLNK